MYPTRPAYHHGVLQILTRISLLITFVLVVSRLSVKAPNLALSQRNVIYDMIVSEKLKNRQMADNAECSERNAIRSNLQSFSTTKAHHKSACWQVTGLSLANDDDDDDDDDDINLRPGGASETDIPRLWMAVLGWPLAGVYLVHLP